MLRFFRWEVSLHYSLRDIFARIFSLRCFKFPPVVIADLEAIGMPGIANGMRS
jgi:hypothetical protein